jgi:acyl-CoA synthetase (AMP-forming)/AMP-acid ligase II
MLNRLLFEEFLPDAQPAVVTSDRTTNWAALREQAQTVFSTQEKLRRRRVGLSFRPAADSYAALAALDRLACDVFLLDANLPSEEALRLSEKLKLGAFLTAGNSGQLPDFEVHELSNEEKWSGSSSVTILTSGSTGEPKAARHSWESIARPVKKGAGIRAPKWLLTYRPNLYAGLQVMLQCFADRGTLVVPDPHMDPQSTVQFMCDAGVQFVSATPSYWRRLLMFSDAELLKRVPLVQITLGGEAIDQPILDKLRQHFPQARLVHIYATTELGRCFSVSDGKAGFPASYLHTVQPGAAELKVHGGELLVRSPNSMRMYDPLSPQQPSASDWFPTGDVVEIKDSRVYFVGRKSDMINVAGSKVFPIEVERVIRIIPGVSDVRVFGKTSSIAGELVACEIVANPDQDREALKEIVVRTCRAQLNSQQQPRIIKLVERIDLSSAGKTLRTRTS